MQASDYENAAALATSSNTSAETLRRIAGTYPDLRALIALHPNTPPDLVARLAREPDAAIQTAVRSRLQWAAPEQRPSVPEQPQVIPVDTEPMQPKKKRSGSRRLLLIPLAIVLVVGMGAGAWFLLNPRDRPLFPAQLSQGIDVAGELLAISPDGSTAAIRRSDTVFGVDTGTGRELWSEPTPEDAVCPTITTAIGCSNWGSDVEIDTGKSLPGGLHRGESHGGSGVALVENKEENMIYEAYRDGEVVWKTPDDWAWYEAQATDKLVLFYGSYYFSPPRHIEPQAILVDIETGETMATVPMNMEVYERALLASDGFMLAQSSEGRDWDMVGYDSDGNEAWTVQDFTMPVHGNPHYYGLETSMPTLSVVHDQLVESRSAMNSTDADHLSSWRVFAATSGGILFDSDGGGGVGPGLVGDRNLEDWTGEAGFSVSRELDESKCDKPEGGLFGGGGWENCLPEAYGPYVVRDMPSGEAIQELDLPHEGELALVGTTLAHAVDDRVTFWTLEAA